MSASFPEGLSEDNLTLSWWSRQGRRLGLLVLIGFLAAALLGVFGGRSNEQRTQSAEAVELSVSAPRTLREGEFFEIVIDLTARQPIAQPVIAIPVSSFRQLTINTTLPEPASQKFGEGAFLLEYDPLERGDRLTVKIDGQSNPTLFGGTSGTLAVRDGETVLADMPLGFRVFP